MEEEKRKEVFVPKVKRIPFSVYLPKHIKILPHAQRMDYIYAERTRYFDLEDQRNYDLANPIEPGSNPEPIPQCSLRERLYYPKNFEEFDTKRIIKEAAREVLQESGKPFKSFKHLDNSTKLEEMSINEVVDEAVREVSKWVPIELLLPVEPLPPVEPLLPIAPTMQLIREACMAKNRKKRYLFMYRSFSSAIGGGTAVLSYKYDELSYCYYRCE